MKGQQTENRYTLHTGDTIRHDRNNGQTKKRQCTLGITKLILICLIGAIIEVIQMVLIDKGYFLGKPDPDAVTVTAHKCH